MNLFVSAQEKKITLQEAGNRLKFFLLLFSKYIMMIMVINLMFCFSSLLIVTILPAFVALQYTFYALIHGDDAFVRNFFAGFKLAVTRYFKFMCAQTACLAALVISGIFYFVNGFAGENPACQLAACLTGIGILHVLLMSIYYYPVLFEGERKQLKAVVKECVKLCLASFLPAFLYLAVFISGLFLLKTYPFLMILFTTFYFSAAAMTAVFMHDYYSSLLKAKNQIN